MDAQKILTDAIKTIGRSLPLGMEVWFGRNDGDPHVHMEIGDPAAQKVTEYRFLNGEPLPMFSLVTPLRGSQFEIALRDLLATTDYMTGLKAMERALLDSYIESTEDLRSGDWLPDAGHLANAVTHQPAAVSYPTGSLGEPVEDQEWI